MLLIIGYTKTQVLIWDVEAQPNRHAVLGATNSRPDLVLFFSLTVKRPFPLFKSFLTYRYGKFTHYYLRENLHFGSVL